MKDTNEFETEKTVGPQCYDIKPLVASNKVVQSNMRTAPSYSFQKTKTQFKVQGPGVGNYEANSNWEKMSKRSPKAIFGSQSRFVGFNK